MNIIAVDDERAALWAVERAVQTVMPQAQITCFRGAEEALEHAGAQAVDVAFLDIEMNEMNGLVLAKKLKELRGDTNIIFVTGYSEYMKHAFDMHASGYVLKPIDQEQIAKELHDLRKPLHPPEPRIRIQCFGNFEVFVQGKPLLFHRSKSKEALAYLVDRKGAGVSKKELAAILFEDGQYTRSAQSYLHTILTDMLRTLAQEGIQGMVIKAHNHYSVDIRQFTCDLYQYEAGEAAAVNNYHGEYMANYSWAEFLAGRLTRET